jgi:dolichol-phosphate mannosyltransferase
MSAGVMNDLETRKAVTGRPGISVIIPIYNEEENVPLLFEQLMPVLKSIGRSFEIVAVNDGSSDGSLAALVEATRRYPELRVVSLRRNFGQTAAIMAAIDVATGEIVVPMDADLQNDPRDIPRLLEKLDEGFDVVSGWRKNRKDAAIRRNLVSRIANSLISSISGVRLHDYGCTLKAYRSEILQGVRLYGEMHRFIPIYARLMGARVTELPVSHNERKYGKSKYGLERVIKVALDLMVVKFLQRYLTTPIYVFGGVGIFAVATSFLILGYTVFLKFFKGVPMILTPLPLLAALTFLVGVMSLLMGLLAEIVVRTYFESQEKMPYSIDRIIQGGQTS